MYSGKKQDEAITSFCLMLATPLPKSCFGGTETIKISHTFVIQLGG